MSGFLLQYVGGQAALGLNALSFLWSAAWLKGIRSREALPPQPEERVPLRKQIGEGLRFVLADPILRAFAGSTVQISLFQSFQLAIGVLFLLREIHLTPGMIGLVSTTSLTGALAGAFTARRLGTRFGEARMIWVAAVGFGVGYLGFPLTQPGWGLVCYVVGGFVTAFSLLVLNVHQVSFQQAATPLGSLLAGVVATTAGLRVTLWVSALGVLTAAVWLVFSPLRAMRTLPVAERP